ncbi:M14 family metallopeptidase [Embleya hyalina]|uniref:Carboxypeptidase n=1 Tax=Embleya hyalina TaxID=516124 RepID=A0A401YW84_9ACTN|nr:M14 family metallocarboxypeptidase [Embleya hyalina]GCD98864.1 carboxypeptidase [Embleya hyalina]
MLLVALVAGVALGPAPASGGRGGRITTGFERRGGLSWTTAAEERDLLRELIAAAPSPDRVGWEPARVTVTRVGGSARGRDVELITVSGARTVPEPIRVLFVCGQHGDEPAGREACLKLVRDLADDRSAAGRRLLERVTVLVLPTPNPDGLAAGTRATAEGVDLNRDHLAVASPEARAVRRVLRETRPHIVHDLHEFDVPTDASVAPTLYLWPRNLNVDPELRGLAVELARDRIGSALRAAGWASDVYGADPTGRLGGDGDERLLRNAAALDHAVAVLVEVDANPTSALERDDAALLHRRRVGAHLVAARATLRMAAERGEAVTSAIRASRARAEHGPERVYLDGADNLPATWAAPLEPPCAYRLTPAQYATARATLAEHGIRVSPDLRVRTAQPAGVRATLLLDPRARFAIADGTPEPCGEEEA